MPENGAKKYLKDTNRLYLMYLTILYLRYPQPCTPSHSVLYNFPTKVIENLNPTQALRGGKETVIGVGGGGGDLKTEFSRVSEDMNELVFHLDTIQNDISELAGRPISVYDNNS